MLWLRNREDPRWQEMSRIIQELVPEVGAPFMPVEGNQVSIVFRDAGGNLHNLKDLGTGVEQLLMTIYVGLVHDKARLVLIEEPETNLHPGAQRWLARSLREWSKTRLMLVATHSSTFLDRAGEIPASVWIVERRDGRSTVRMADETLSDALRALGVRLSDVLSAEGIILVEGESDLGIIEHWFGELLHQNGIVVVPMGGGDSAWRFDQFEEWLEAGNTLVPRSLCLRDRDELDATAVAKLEAAGVHVLHRRELENYLLEGGAVRAAVHARLEEAGLSTAEWSEERIAREMRAAADTLKTQTLLKRVAYRLGSLRPLSRDDIRGLAVPTVRVEDVRQRIEENWASLANLEAIWREESEQLERAWPDRWRDIAPGAAVLEALYTVATRRYDKNRDGVRLAQRIPAPDELRRAVQDFVNKVRRADGQEAQAKQ
jgi:hypothetical protein